MAFSITGSGGDFYRVADQTWQGETVTWDTAPTADTTLLASFGFAISLSLVSVDAATVRHNLPRALHGVNINIDHLSTLSTDAVPPLVEEFQKSEYSELDHQQIGAIIVCYMHYQSYESKNANDWRSFTLSRWRAHQAIASIQAPLQEYGINTDQYRARVRTPSGKYYECGFSDFELARR